MIALDSEFLLKLFSYYGLGSLITGAQDALQRRSVPGAKEQKITPDDLFTQEELQRIADKFEDAGLCHSASLLRDWPHRKIPTDVFMPELQRRIEHELESVLWLHVPSAKRKHYSEIKGFGEEVAAAFPSAAYDIEEASKCFALSRHTACVFHLMRTIEVGLHVLAKTLNDPRLDPKRNPSWDSILKKCREELEKERLKRAPEWATDDVFFSGAVTNLMGVKDAWRNPTLHVEINYDEERALDVWNHVRAFMRHLAIKLSE